MPILYMILGWLLCYSSAESNRQVSFLLLTSSSTDFDTSGVVAAVDMAVKEIQQASNLLTGYRFNYSSVIDTKCSRDKTREILRKRFASNTSLLAVVGCGCSNATLAVADLQIAQSMRRPIVSYASQSKSLENDTLYSSVIRVVPSYSQLPHAVAQFVASFGWKQVLLITEELAVSAKDFETDLIRNDIAVETHLLTDKLSYNSSLLSDRRIMILDVRLSTAKLILCQAFLLRKFYPSYAWIIVDNFSSGQWWDVTYMDSGCTNEQIGAVLSYSVLVTIHSASSNNSSTNISRYDPFAYDAVWTLALALNESLQSTTEQLFAAFDNVQFQGASGNVEFNGRDRSDIVIHFNQFTDNDTSSGNILQSEIAVYNYSSNELNVLKPSNSVWPLGVPSDGIPVIVFVSIQTANLVISVFLSATGLTWALICLFFVVVWRQAKVVRLTSPKLNYLMIIGSIFTYSSLVMYNMPLIDEKTFEILCIVRRIFLTVLGYDICISVTTVKIWRIYYIFVNPKPGAKVPQDGHLLVIVLLLTAVDLLILIVSSALTDYFTSPNLILRNSISTEATGQVIEFHFLSCSNEIVYYRIFQVWTILHKVVLHVISIYFAFRIRKIKITVLNEYKATAAIAYCSITFVVITVVVLPVIGQYPNIYGLVYDGLLFILVTLFLSFTFIPKMVELWRDPKGEKVFVHQEKIEKEPASPPEVVVSNGLV